MIEAQERHEKSPKKKTSRTARCGSSGGLLIYFFLYLKTENKSVNVWRKEMLQSVYPLYTFPDNIYFVYVPGKNTFEPKINYLLKVFLRLTEKFLRIFLRSLITCVNAACIHLNKMYTPLFAQFIGMPLLKHSSFLHQQNSSKSSFH